MNTRYLFLFFSNIISIVHTIIKHFSISDVSGSYQTLTKRVETCVLDNSVIGTSKGGLSNVRTTFLLLLNFHCFYDMFE